MKWPPMGRADFEKATHLLQKNSAVNVYNIDLTFRHDNIRVPRRIEKPNRLRLAVVSRYRKRYRKSRQSCSLPRQGNRI
jgi:hypothetical protein